MDRWAEYDAGTLTPPVVVQHDTDARGIHLVWVWTGRSIQGPFQRKTLGALEETELLSLAVTMDNPLPDTFVVTGEDGARIEGTL